jgi:pimeloyl-ACP methyl ester carboxylesterase
MKTLLPQLLLLCALLGLAACETRASLAEATSEPTPPTSPPAILTGPGVPGVLRPAACPFVLPEGLVEGRDVECSYLPVYENRGEGKPAEGRILRLAVAVFHPPGGASQPDPVIYLSGGPGASILKIIRYHYDLLSEPVFATGRSLIVFDQRGIGLSRPALDCHTFNDLSLELQDRQIEGQLLSEEEVSELVLESLRECKEELGQTADLAAYNSTSSAEDVHDLRQALGYKLVNLWGGSYGTRLALEVMRAYPEDLRSAVLDAVYPPDVDLYVEGPANFQRSLTRLFESCAANQVCRNAQPDLEKVFYDTIQRLNAEPVLREISNFYTGESYEALVNGDTLLALTFQLLYDSRVRYLIPGIIYDVSQGDFNYLDKAYSSLISMSSLSSRGMMLSVQCREEVPFSSWDAFQAEIERHPHLASMYQGSILGDLIYSACEVWSAGLAKPSANQPVESDVPTLILNGEFDPITPPAWGFHAAQTLENAYAFEFPGIGHGASIADECPLNMMIAFLDNPKRAPDESCILEMQ